MPKRPLVAITFTLLMVALTQTACAPKVGSADWCKALEKKAKGDWTANDAGDYAKYCVIGLKPEE